MPRAMVHPRFKQRIISDPPSATVSPDPGNPPDNHVDDQDQDAEADMDDEGESMNISDDGDAVANEEGDGDEQSQGYEPESNRSHALSHFNSRRPTSSTQNNNNNNIKNSKFSGAGSASASVSRSATIMDHPVNRAPQSSDPPDSSVRRSSRAKPPSSSKEVSESYRSPTRKPLKIKLKLGSKPTPELEDEKPTPPTTTTRSSTRRAARGGRARGKGKNATVALSLPSRASEVLSRRPASPSEASVRTSPESEDDPDAEMDIDPERELDPEADEVNVEEQDGENMDEDEDEDSEVLPGQGTRSRMTSRQAVLASKVDAEHVELTTTGSSRKKQLTTEEIALRREETARKRKNLNEKKLEDEKTETINRLLKKQSSRSRAKRAALNASIAATPQSHSGGEEGESDHPVSEKPRGMPGPAWRWISSKDGYKLGIPFEIVSSVGLESIPPPTPPTPPISICDVEGCSHSRKYRLVNDFNRGACGMEHMRLLSGKV